MTTNGPNMVKVIFIAVVLGSLLTGTTGVAGEPARYADDHGNDQAAGLQSGSGCLSFAEMEQANQVKITRYLADLYLGIVQAVSPNPLMGPPPDNGPDDDPTVWRDIPGGGEDHGWDHK